MENKRIAWLSGLSFGAMAHGLRIGDDWAAIGGGVIGLFLLVACSGIMGPALFAFMLWREEEKENE